MKSKRKKTCPCCGNLTIATDNKNLIHPGTICPVCYWEIDPFINNDNERSDQNSGLTLAQARLNYKTFGAAGEQWVNAVRKPYDTEKQSSLNEDDM